MERLIESMRLRVGGANRGPSVPAAAPVHSPCVPASCGAQIWASKACKWAKTGSAATPRPARNFRVQGKGSTLLPRLHHKHEADEVRNGTPS